MRPGDPGRYGRVVVADGLVQRIVEWADADAAERAIGLCNAGVFCAAGGDLARWLGAVRPSAAKGEYYLTDCVALAAAEGRRVVAVEADEAELRGVNSRVELAAAEATVQGWLRRAAMEGGATLTAPETVTLSADTVLAPDTVVGPHVVFGPGVRVASGAEIRAFCHLEGCDGGGGGGGGAVCAVAAGDDAGGGVACWEFCGIEGDCFGGGGESQSFDIFR